MPSYRVRLAVGTLLPGTSPAAVLPAAADAAAATATVEARDVAIVRGEAVVSVRFTADDDAGADHVARQVDVAVRALARTGLLRLDRRAGARWLVVVGGPTPGSGVPYPAVGSPPAASGSSRAGEADAATRPRRARRSCT